MWRFFIQIFSLYGLVFTPFSVANEAEPQHTQLPALDVSATDNDDSRYFFDPGVMYGSESQFGPFNVLFNVGLVVPGRLHTTPELGDIDWKAGWSEVRYSLTHQNEVIDNSGGSQEALDKEVIPFAHPSGAWLPNYALHFLGEGMLSRKLEEYFIHSGYSPVAAKVAAITTITTSQLVNEVVEYELPWEQRLDPLADFYFNLAGVIAFSFDDVAEWFSSGSRQLLYWPGQPIIDVRSGAICNQGENYLFRFGEGYKWSAIMGMPHNGFGLGIPMDNEEFEFLTVMLATDVIIPQVDEDFDDPKYDRGSNFRASDVAEQYLVSLNTYYDRKGALLFSSALSFYPSKQLTLNLYPNSFQWNQFGLGAYAILSEEGASSAGITLAWSPFTPGIRW